MELSLVPGATRLAALAAQTAQKLPDLSAAYDLRDCDSSDSGTDDDDVEEAIATARDSFAAQVALSKPETLCELPEGELTAPEEYHTFGPGEKHAWLAAIGPQRAAEHRAFALLRVWPMLVAADFTSDMYAQLQAYSAVSSVVADLIDDGARFVNRSHKRIKLAKLSAEADEAAADAKAAAAAAVEANAEANEATADAAEAERASAAAAKRAQAKAAAFAAASRPV